MLGSRVGRDFLVQLFRDLDEAPAVDVAEELEVPQLISQLKEGAHQLFDLVVVQVGDDLGAPAIAILEELEAAVRLGELLVVELVDILEVAVQGEEELYGEGLGDEATSVNARGELLLPTC